MCSTGARIAGDRDTLALGFTGGPEFHKRLLPKGVRWREINQVVMLSR